MFRVLMYHAHRMRRGLHAQGYTTSGWALYQTTDGVLVTCVATPLSGGESMIAEMTVR